MHRNDTTNFLLYIEPKSEEKLEIPIDDNLSRVMEYALSRAKIGAANYNSENEEPRFSAGMGYKGFHRTDCNTKSDNKDYLLENGMITNSLATFYVKWYRNSIEENDMNKLKELEKFYDGKDLTIKNEEKVDRVNRVSRFNSFTNNRRMK